MVGSPLPGSQFEPQKWHRTMDPFPLNGSKSPKPDMFTFAWENKLCHKSDPIKNQIRLDQRKLGLFFCPTAIL